MKQQPIQFFETDFLYMALEECARKKYDPAYMPSLVDLKTQFTPAEDSEMWYLECTTPSIMALGKTTKGNEVGLIAHCPNYLTAVKTLQKASFEKYEFSDEKKSKIPLQRYIIPQEEFERLVQLDGNGNVFVIDYNSLLSRGTLKDNTVLETVSLDELLSHPLAIPFFGGKERAERYMKKSQEITQSTQINFQYDLGIFDYPTGTFLGLNNIWGGPEPIYTLDASGKQKTWAYMDLSDDCVIKHQARFLGVKQPKLPQQVRA